MNVTKGLFDNHMQLLHKSLDLRTRRNALLSGNIANVETPGYQAKDIVFEKELGQAMKAHVPGPLNVTNTRHLDGRNVIPLWQVKPGLIRSANPIGNIDGNTVDLEKEMAKLAENQVLYQGLTQMISHKFTQLKTTIREGGS